MVGHQIGSLKIATQLDGILKMANKQIRKLEVVGQWVGSLEVADQ